MSFLDDLDDSGLFCKSLIQKQKAIENNNLKNSKQLKLGFSQTKIKQASQVHLTSDINSQLNESTSSYFSTKKPSKNCPLCLKVFKGDSVYSAHMKQCAKAHKMTTKQLLKALELQKKQIQERRELGLCSQNLPPVKKTISKPKFSENEESYDLALGLALSKSLASGTEIQKATLEEFGFTSSNTVQKSWKKKKESNKSVLRERTAEERQRIIVEKVAMVLLDEEEKKEIDRKVNQTLICQKTQDLKLWNLGENHDKSVWYVDRIKTLVLSDKINDEENIEPLLPDDISNEINKLNLPHKDFLHQSWKKLINNSFKSDLILKTKDGHDVYLHSLVLYTRCSEASERDYHSAFQKFNFSTILILLEFLYCGTLNALIRSEADDLFNLASELNFSELIQVLNCLKNLIIETPKLNHTENKDNALDILGKNELENSEKDLFSDDIVDLTNNSPKSNESVVNVSENESNAEKSYWSFIQLAKRKENLEEIKKSEKEENAVVNKHVEKMEVERTSIFRESEEKSTKEKISQMSSDDSATKDLEFQNGDDKASADCIILSSDSESKDHFLESTHHRSKSPSPVDYEMPYFDPYDNFRCFSEERFSPVGLHSQSLLTGNVSTESLKLSITPQPDAKLLEGLQKTVTYCSTPMTARQNTKIKSKIRNSVEGSWKKRSDPSASRILRKSLGLHTRKPNSSQKLKRKNCKKFAEKLANSIVKELSKSPAFKSSPVGVNKFVEITPISKREELGEAVTPYPNYSNMGETMLKEHLSKYGLKKTLAKSKARKILRFIYEELHPFYNTKTGKIIKMISADSPKARKKLNCKTLKESKNNAKRKKKNLLNFSVDSEEILNCSLEKPRDDSCESEFDDLNETLTQSMPNNPVDLPSAFSEYLRNNPEYHQKILLYEPIWLEELQKKLKETFKKHFKMSDIMDYLDQKCITFRSEAQAKKLQERYKKKRN